MSTLGTVRDNIATKLTTLFPNKKRVPRPRVISENIDNILNDSWGIYIGAGSESDQNLGYHYAVRSNEILVILTKKIYTLENSYTGEALAEDTLQDEKDAVIQKVSEITRESIDNDFLNIIYGGDDGGEYIFNDKNNYLALTITFLVTYSKDKTYCI